MRESESRHSASRKKTRAVLPGLGLAIAITVISGIVCWFWLASGGINPARAAVPGISDLAEVQESDISGALGTMSGSNAALAPYREGKDGNCPQPIAWVTLVSAPGEPPGHIRLISGSYFSPVFEVSATPIRVAIPFPAPYESGRGVLTAINVGGVTAVSLLPTWRVSAKEGRTTRPVTWTPTKSCKRNG